MSQFMKCACEAVRVVEAIKRIPLDQRPGVTYFSVWDTWLFQARSDTKVCDLCKHYETWGEIRGDQLRTEFPYLVILDEDTIGGSEPDGGGLVHPNCRCYLTRKIG